MLRKINDRWSNKGIVHWITIAIVFSRIVLTIVRFYWMNDFSERTKIDDDKLSNSNVYWMIWKKNGSLTNFERILNEFWTNELLLSVLRFVVSNKRQKRRAKQPEILKSDSLYLKVNLHGSWQNYILNTIGLSQQISNIMEHINNI